MTLADHPVDDELDRLDSLSDAHRVLPPVVVSPTPPVPEAPMKSRSTLSDMLAGASSGPSDEDPGMSGSAPVTRIDVEFAHMCAVPCDELLTEAEIAGSARVADGVVRRLRCDPHLSVTTSVLVDDKKNVTADMDERRRAAIDRCVGELRADRVMLESELVHHLRAFSRALGPLNPIVGGFYGRLRRRGELGCSQDITIWHALRLGLFEPVDPGWAWDSVARGRADPADVCVVILPRRFQTFEEKAYTENLGTFLDEPNLDVCRMTMTGTLGDRQVLLWAIWIDVAVDPSEDELRRLGELGRAEAAELHHALLRSPVLDTIS